MYLPYDLLKNLIYFNDRINNLFEEKLKSIYSATEMSEGASWSPTVDIYETESALYLTAELPGIDLKHVKIEVKDNQLVLSGHRPFPKEGLKREDYHRLEGSYGSFERKFSLPSAVNMDAIEAKLKDGLLKVMIPKKPRRKVTKVSIKSD